MKRITTERLATIQEVADINDGYPDAFSGELLQALQAEREYSRGLQSRLDAVLKYADELEAERSRLVDETIELRNAIPKKWRDEPKAFAKEFQSMFDKLQRVEALPRFDVSWCDRYGISHDYHANGDYVDADELREALK